MIINLSIFIVFLSITKLSAFLTGQGSAVNETKFPEYSHYSIDQLAFKSVFSADDIDQVYFGDFLRDASQFFNSKIASVFRTGRVLDYLIEHEFGNDANVGQVSWDDIGTYNNVDHVDNPLTPENEDKGLVEADEIGVNPNTNVVNYMATTGPWPTSLGKIISHLDSASDSWKAYCNVSSISGERKEKLRNNFLREIGAITHTMSDFYAHSNYIELGLLHLVIKNHSLSFTPGTLKDFHRIVFPWVGNETFQPCGSTGTDYCYPVVSGRGSESLGEVFATLLNVFNSKLKNNDLDDAEEEEDNSKFAELKVKLREWAIESNEKKLKQRLEKDNINFRNTKYQSPTHFQLNKDTWDNPLHQLAAQCAIENSHIFAKSVKRFMETCNAEEIESGRSELILIASQVFTHPYFTNETYPPGPSKCMRRISDFMNDSNTDLQKLTFENSMRRERR